MTQSAHQEHRPSVGQEPADAARQMPKSMQHLYPMGDILAVIDDRAAAERAVQALKAAGVPEGDVDVVDGAWFTSVMRANKENWNPLQRVVALLGAEEGEVVRDNVQQAEQGHTLLVIHAEQPSAWECIAGVLKEHGAHHLRHYGRMEMTLL
jgi:hypothetical protein